MKPQPHGESDLIDLKNGMYYFAQTPLQERNACMAPSVETVLNTYLPSLDPEYTPSSQIWFQFDRRLCWGRNRNRIPSRLGSWLTDACWRLTQPPFRFTIAATPPQDIMLPMVCSQMAHMHPTPEQHLCSTTAHEHSNDACPSQQHAPTLSCRKIRKRTNNPLLYMARTIAP